MAFSPKTSKHLQFPRAWILAAVVFLWLNQWILRGSFPEQDQNTLLRRPRIGRFVWRCFVGRHIPAANARHASWLPEMELLGPNLPQSYVRLLLDSTPSRLPAIPRLKEAPLLISRHSQDATPARRGAALSSLIIYEREVLPSVNNPATSG